MKRNLRARLLLLPFITLLIAVSGCREEQRPAAGFDWPRWRGPNGDGISLETDWNPKALEGGPRVLWEADIGIGYSGISIEGGELFTAGITKAGNAVSCLEAETGNIRWQYAYGGKVPQATPAVEGDSVYFLTDGGIVFCLNRKNGKPRWRTDLVSECNAKMPYYGFAGSPVVEGEWVLINANLSGIALQKSTGRLVWASEKPPEGLEKELGDDNGVGYMTPVVCSTDAGSHALVYSWQGLSSVDVKTGKLLWQYAWPSYIILKTPDPVLVEDKILIADDNDGDIYRRFSTLLQIENGVPSVLWQSPELYSDVSTPIVIDGYIYGAYGGKYSISRSTSLRCLSLEDGRLMWKHSEKILGREWISLTCADGKIIVLEESGKLSVIEASPEAYREISTCVLQKGEKKYRGFFTTPVLCNGRIYCRGFGGELVCVDMRS